MPPIPILPNEIVLTIAQCSTETFRAMLLLPPVAAAVQSSYTLAAIQYKFTTRIDGSKGVFYRLCGRSHRCDDQPAVCVNGRLEWHQYGKYHRDGDQPAVVDANGDQAWYQHGERYRGADQL